MYWPNFQFVMRCVGHLFATKQDTKSYKYLPGYSHLQSLVSVDTCPDDSSTDYTAVIGA